jgi:hypothetical protein
MFSLSSWEVIIKLVPVMAWLILAMAFQELKVGQVDMKQEAANFPRSSSLVGTGSVFWLLGLLAAGTGRSSSIPSGLWS